VVYAAYTSTSDPVGRQRGYRPLDRSGEPLAQLPILGGYMSGFREARPLL
jgi:hypothetical protein